MNYTTLQQQLATDEIRPVADFPGYFVSRNGTVYSLLSRANSHCSRCSDFKVRTLVPRKTATGYLRVGLHNPQSGKRCDRYIHRLVASAFVANPDGHRTVHHKNHNRADNCADNLAWVSRGANTCEAMQHKAEQGNVASRSFDNAIAPAPDSLVHHIHSMYRMALEQLSQAGLEYSTEFQDITFLIDDYEKHHDWHNGPCCIYEIRNIITGDSYVGQTFDHPRWRISRHLAEIRFRNSSHQGNPRKMSLLQHAFAAYGTAAFTVSILEYGISADTVLERESHWMKNNDTLFPMGYNLDYQYDFTSGAHKLRHVTQLDPAVVEQIIRELQTAHSTAEIAKKFDVTRDNVRKINLGIIYHDCHIQYPISNKITVRNTGIFPAVYARYVERKQQKPQQKKKVSGAQHAKGRSGAFGDNIGSLLTEQQFIEITHDLEDLSLSMTFIAQKWQMSLLTLEQINYGAPAYMQLYPHIVCDYPVRIDSQMTSHRYKHIIMKIISTDETWDTIGNLLQVEASIVQSINEGSKYRNPALCYPLRTSYTAWSENLSDTSWMIVRDTDTGIARYSDAVAGHRVSTARARRASSTLPRQQVQHDLESGRCKHLAQYGTRQDYYIYADGTCVSVRILADGSQATSARIRRVDAAMRFSSPVVALPERETGHMKKVPIDRLVAEAFVSNPSKYEYVRHIDGNWKNCSADNLIWVADKIDWRSRHA